MTALHQRDFLQKLGVLFSLSLIFDLPHDLQTEKETSEHRTSTCHTASTTATAPASPQEKKATKSLGHALDPSKQEKGCYSILLADVIHTDIPGYQNFVRMPHAFSHLIEECRHHCIKKSVTNFRKALEVGLKLAITLRHLATGVT